MQKSVIIWLCWLIPAGCFAEQGRLNQTSIIADNVTADLDSSNPLNIDAVIDEPDPKKNAGLWDKFTFKFNQQVYAQVNPHTTSSGLYKPAGIEDNRLNMLVKYQNAFAPTWNLQGSGQAKLYWPSDYDVVGKNSQSIEMEQRLGNTESRLNEFYISKSFTNQTFKLGRQTLVWGEAEGNSVLDLLNTLEYRDLSIIEMEDARLNQWFLSWDIFKDSSRISTFVNLNPQFNPLPRVGSPAYIPILFPIVDPNKNKLKFEAGSRIQWSIAHSDITLMAAYLYDNPLHYSTPATIYGNIIANESPYGLLGASANRAIGKLLLKLDFAYSQGLLADTVLAPQFAYPLQGSASIRKNQLAATFGFDYALDNEQSITASVQARSFLDYTAGLTTGETMLYDRLYGTWLIRYNRSFQNGNWVFTSYNRGSLNADQVLSSLMLAYTVNDHWSVMGTLIGTLATKESTAYMLDKDLRVGFTISYSL